MKILQGNLHRSRLADSLLDQLVVEKDTDLVLLCEQYRDRNPRSWFVDLLGTAAIWIPDLGKVPAEACERRAGYVWIKSRGVTYISCYFTPNDVSLLVVSMILGGSLILWKMISGG